MRKVFCLFAVSVMMLPACKKNVEPQVIAVESVTVSPSTLTLTEGETKSLSVTVLPENATSPEVKWSSSSTSVATVEDGKVTAVAAGSAVITATADGKKGTCTVTVDPKVIAVTGVSLIPQEKELIIGETFTLVATVLPAEASDPTVTWSSSAPEIATVENGLVSALAEGAATITVTTKDGGKTADCQITVKLPALSVSEAISENDGAGFYIFDAIVAAISSDGFVLTDGTGNVFVNGGDISAFHVGDKLNIKARKQTTGGLPVLEVSESEVVSSGNDVPRTELVDITSTIDSYVPTRMDYVSVTGSFFWNGDNPAIRVAGRNKIACAYGSTLPTTVETGFTVEMVGYVQGFDDQAVYLVAERISYLESLFFEDFEEGSFVDNWTFIDADGDGYNWVSGAQIMEPGYGINGSNDLLISQSYDNNISGALCPDNWAFTPAISLSDKNNILSFWITAQDADYPNEHYAVYIAEEIPSGENLASQCTILMEQTFPHTPTFYTTTLAAAPQTKSQASWLNICISLPDSFRDKTVHIGFRHFDSYDQFYLNLDDVKVEGGNPKAVAAPLRKTRPARAGSSSSPDARRR